MPSEAFSHIQGQERIPAECSAQCNFASIGFGCLVNGFEGFRPFNSPENETAHSFNVALNSVAKALSGFAPTPPPTKPRNLSGRLRRLSE
jgi:hypothetical protein